MSTGSFTCDLLIVLCVFILLPVANGLHFYLHAGENRCFYDEAPYGSKVLGEYTVTTGKGSMSIDLDVRNGKGDILYYHQASIEHGKFAFVLHQDNEEPPPVQHAEVHWKHRGSDVHGQPSRGEFTDWDQDKYQGIDEDALSKDEQKIRSRKERRGIRKNADPVSGFVPEYDQLDASIVGDRDIQEIFDVQRFQICLTTSTGPDQHGFQRQVRLVVRKGSAAHDYHRIAKKEHMTNLEVSLNQISAELHELLADLEYAHRMEEALRILHYQTNRSVVTFAIVSVVVIFVIGAIQARYTRVVLKSKKLL